MLRQKELPAKSGATKAILIKRLADGATSFSPSDSTTNSPRNNAKPLKKSKPKKTCNKGNSVEGIQTEKWSRVHSHLFTDGMDKAT